MSLRWNANVPPVPKMPPGLVELMDGLARDVLKNNPENIFEFCALHMQTLLKIRDGHVSKPSMTLEQKIAKAQKKITQRAEKRRRAYDDNICAISAMNVGEQQAQLLLPGEEVGVSHPQTRLAENLSTDKKSEEKVSDIEQADENKAEKVNETMQEIEEKEEKINEVMQEVEEKERNIVEIIQQTEKPNDDKSVDELKINDNENMLITVTDDEVNIEQQNESSQDISRDKHLDKSKITILMKDEQKINDNAESIVIDDGFENNRVHETCIALNKFDVEPDTKIGHNNSIVLTNALQNASDDQLKMDHDSNKTINTEKNKDSEIITQKDSEIEIQTEIDNISMKDTNNDVNSIENGKVEEIISLPIETNSEDNPKTDDDVHTNIEVCDTDTKALIESTDQNGDGKVLISENKMDAFGNHTEHDNKSEIEQDEKILAVILNTDGLHPDFAVEKKEPDSGPNSSIGQKKEVMDAEIVIEPMDERIKSNNINSSMDLETAAITIQKVFRSFLFKTKTASYDDPTTVDISLLNEVKEKEECDGLNVNIKDRRLLGISRMDTVLQTVNEEKSLSLSTDDSSTLSSAATIIQAHVRGFLVRNKCNLNKTTSSNSLIDSDAPSIPSLEADSDNRKNKTVLNIHIVPEGVHYVSRDESILTSMDLSLDSSPPSSVNLHPLGYDKSERRKQLKREDAIQSVSPPSNNSGKLSDELDSVKEVLAVDNNTEVSDTVSEDKTKNIVSEVMKDGEDKVVNVDSSSEIVTSDAADELDVITPFIPIEGRSPRESDNSSKLLHSGEFHDIVVPTNVTRSDTSVVREFQNVLVYFILWNN